MPNLCSAIRATLGQRQFRQSPGLALNLHSGNEWGKIPVLTGLIGPYHSHKTLQSSQPSDPHQLFTIQPPRSTRFSSTLTLLRHSVTSSHKSSNRSIAIAASSLEQTPASIATNI